MTPITDQTGHVARLAEREKKLEQWAQDLAAVMRDMENFNGEPGRGDAEAATRIAWLLTRQDLERVQNAQRCDF
jgi:hypothetical protein